MADGMVVARRLLARALVIPVTASLALAGVPVAAWAEVPPQSEAEVAACGGMDFSEERQAVSEAPSAVSQGHSAPDAAMTSMTSVDVDEPSIGVCPSVGEAPSLAPAAADACSVTVSVSVVESDGTLSYWLVPTSETFDVPVSAMDATKAVLEGNGLVPVIEPDTGYGPYLSDIVMEGRTLPDADGAYWGFLVNGAYASVGAGSYQLAPGDAVEWRYAAFGSAAIPGDVEADDTSRALTDPEAAWPSFEPGGNVTAVVTPTAVAPSWETLLGGGFKAVSEPVIADGCLFAAVNGVAYGDTSPYAQVLVRVNLASGVVEATTPLAAGIADTCRIAYAHGLIYVPLVGGSVQAVNVATMRTRWVSLAPGNEAGTVAQASTTVSVLGNVVFSGTINQDASYALGGGAMLALDATSGSLRSDLALTDRGVGFFWTNVVEVDGHYLTADNAGTLYAFASDGWEPRIEGTLALGAAVNADLAVYEGDVIVVTSDGVVHRVAVQTDGTLVEVGRVGAVGYATALTVADGLALVPEKYTQGDTVRVAVIDLATMAALYDVTADVMTGEHAFRGGIGAPVLVSRQAGRTIGYFTTNVATGTDRYFSSYASGGDAFWFALGEAHAQRLYAPTGIIANACDSPLVTDGDGALYYLNDSGYLVRLAGDDEGTAPGGSEAGGGQSGDDAVGGGDAPAPVEGPGVGDGAAGVGSVGVQDADRPSGRGAGVGHIRSGGRGTASHMPPTRDAAGPSAGAAATRGRDGSGRPRAKDGASSDEMRTHAVSDRSSRSRDDADDSPSVPIDVKAATDREPADDAALADGGAASPAPDATLPTAVAGVVGGLAAAGAFAWWLWRLVTGRSR